jgi:hypothetical protein
MFSQQTDATLLSAMGGERTCRKPEYIGIGSDLPTRCTWSDTKRTAL